MKLFVGIICLLVLVSNCLVVNGARRRNCCCDVDCSSNTTQGRPFRGRQMSVSRGEQQELVVSREEFNQLQARIETLESTTSVLQSCLVEQATDCSDVAKFGFTASGVYNVSVNGVKTEVYCDLENDGGNWLVFQKRFSGEQDFYLNWTDYRNGFGSKSGEFWLGLETLHQLTSRRSYRLRINLEDWRGNTGYAEYSYFTIADESSNYRLNIGSYSGDRGDSLTFHNNRAFSTRDRDNDGNDDVDCAVRFYGAWWYGSCYSSNLNGEYIVGGLGGKGRGIAWGVWLSSAYSLKKAEMKIRPA